jgi:hypothetical protein
MSWVVTALGLSDRTCVGRVSVDRGEVCTRPARARAGSSRIGASVLGVEDPRARWRGESEGRKILRGGVVSPSCCGRDHYPDARCSLSMGERVVKVGVSGWW